MKMQKLTEFGYAGRMVLWGAEVVYTLVIPIYLYGWLRGLLIHSALSSLLHIAGLLCGMFPKYDVSAWEEYREKQKEKTK